MQNDMLKNTIAPWQEKGRWYHGFVESDGTNWTIDTVNSDAIFSDFSISTNYIKLFYETEKSLIDYKYKFYKDPTASYNIPAAGMTLRITSGGSAFFLLPVANYIGKIELWFYID